MRKYKVAMINTRLNFRKYLIVEGYSRIEAGVNARRLLPTYDKIESITCIEQFPNCPQIDIMQLKGENIMNLKDIILFIGILVLLFLGPSIPDILGF